jgi:hypothetical protein
VSIDDVGGRVRRACGIVSGDHTRTLARRIDRREAEQFIPEIDAEKLGILTGELITRPSVGWRRPRFDPEATSAYSYLRSDILKSEPG